MNQLKALLDSLSVKQRISIAVAAVLAGVLLFGVTRWRREGDFKTLYSGMAPEDASAVVQKLKEGGTEYRLSENGTSISIPSAKVAEARLTMASAGLPKSGRIGFELFDKTNFGATDFTEQINYRRALEGELERSIMGLAEVERARVHITFPKDSIFLESRQPAKASVMLTLRGGALAPQSVSSINYLVSSAVEGLSPDAVTIVDMRGTLLSRPKRQNANGGPEPSDAALEYRHQIEKDLLAKINNTLEPLLGADKFRAGISVDCDFSSGEQSEETLDPSRAVMLNSQKTEESTGGASAQGGIPGTNSALPRPGGAQTGRTGGSGTTRRTENISFQPSRVVRRMTLPQGTIRRLSVAVLLDQGLRWEKAGNQYRRVLIPPSDERKKAIRELVAGMIGLNEQRGDQLVLETLPFEATLNQEPPPPPAPPAAPLAVYVENVKKMDPKMMAIVVGGLLGLLFLVVVVRRILKKLFGKKKDKGKGGDFDLAMQMSLPPGAPGSELVPVQAGAAGVVENFERNMENKLAEQSARQDQLEADAINALKLPSISTKKADVLTKHLREEIKKDSRAAAQLVRTWLAEED